jgi:hypothetical protein
MISLGINNMGSDISIGGVSLNVMSIIIAIGIAWGIAKKTTEAQDDKLKAHDTKIDKLFDWKDKHEDDASKERLILHQNISKLEGMLEFRGRENIEIMKQIEKINNNLELMKDDLAYLKIDNKRRKGE